MDFTAIDAIVGRGYSPDGKVGRPKSTRTGSTGPLLKNPNPSENVRLQAMEVQLCCLRIIFKGLKFLDMDLQVLVCSLIAFNYRSL